jgi:hypothetical protein
MKQNKIHNHKSLIEEKQRLLTAVELNERKIVNGVEYFQSNYKSIIWEKVNPFKGKSSFSQIANLVVSEVLPAVIGEGTQALENKSEGNELVFNLVKKGIDLIKKVGKKKSRKKDKEI